MIFGQVSWVPLPAGLAILLSAPVVFGFAARRKRRAIARA